ncbi:hypothetical protein [Sphingopyxis sp. KK2]|uniref:hypothetical protein n=1 Tax=Sphingopyxis sp. KK2 TaxID=1855727 RepID=UPI00097E588F|nr:hypothetical protein [Sphingopyxis sp. KK2]
MKMTSADLSEPRDPEELALSGTRSSSDARPVQTGRASFYSAGGSLEAIDVTEARAADHKGKLNEAYQEAKGAEVRADLKLRYGALLVSAGTAALANMVFRGI